MHQRFSLSARILRGIRFSLLTLCAGALCTTAPAYANDVQHAEHASATVLEPVVNDNARFLAAIQLHSADELRDLMFRAEKMVTNYDGYASREPIAFVLRGEELRLFTRDNYEANRDLIDTAARLEAFGVVDFKACEGWMVQNHLDRDELPAFIDYVENGEQEVQRLQTSGYAWF